MFGRCVGIGDVLGKARRIDRHEEDRAGEVIDDDPPILSAPSSPANGVTAMVTGLKLAPA